MKAQIYAANPLRPIQKRIRESAQKPNVKKWFTVDLDSVFYFRYVVIKKLLVIGFYHKIREF